jgi:carboxyl-terminal processing protease
MNNNNSNRSTFLPLMLALSVVFGVIIGFYLPRKSSEPQHTSIRQRSDKLSSILNIIETSYVDSVNRNELIETAIPAILKKLDPHTVYIPAKDLIRANETLQGNFEGIGISFSNLSDTILIISTIPDGPSEKIGILAGDKIIYVNDSLIAGKGISDEKVMSMLKGPRGTKVKVRVLRKGQDSLLTFNITRDKIPLTSIDVAYMINSSTGYIRITNFALSTYDEFMKALSGLKEEGMTQLIVDLRGNSGGIMDAAIEIAEQFLSKGQLIVYTKGRTQPRNEFRARGNGKFETGNLVILIDETTASASEILAGAIQDNDRGTIIGRRSFGKGLVQEPVSFSDGSGLRLTVARYYTPSGRSIQKPYNKGFEEYYEDLNTRFNRHEFEVSDSIHFPDSLRYTTNNGRIVYGGGGIMPDKFVPYDTSMISPYFLKVRPLIYQYALKYTENNRDVLNKYTDAEELEKYLDKQNLMKGFTDFALSNSVKPDPSGLKISGNFILVQLKGYIARNILDNKGAYPIWEQIDNTLKWAIRFLNDSV